MYQLARNLARGSVDDGFAAGSSVFEQEAKNKVANKTNADANKNIFFISFWFNKVAKLIINL